MVNKLVHLDDESETTEESSVVPNDFSLYVRKSLTDTEKLSALEDHFKPGKGFRFPIRIEYGKKQSFNPSWLDNHNWLVYSPSVDGAYCKFCVLFRTTTEHNSSKIDHLVKSPLTFWTTACEKLKDHGLNSPLHKTATLKSEKFYKASFN